MPDIYELAARQRAALIRREQELADEIARLYAGARGNIQARLDDLVVKIEDALARGVNLAEEHPSWLERQARLSETLNQVDTEIARWSGSVASFVSGATGSSAVHGMRDALTLVGSFASVPVKALESLVAFTAEASPLYERLSANGPAFAQRAKETLFQGLAAGDNPRVIGRALSQALEEPLYNATRIARTETLRSYRSAATETYRANPNVVTGWRWLSAKNRRTCAACLAMDGTEHPMEEDFASHPMCRCTMIPLTSNTRPPRETGREWLTKQPHPVQEEILGKAQRELWASGKIDLSDVVKVTQSEDWGVTRTHASLKHLVQSGKVSREDAVRALGRQPAPPPVPQGPPPFDFDANTFTRADARNFFTMEAPDEFDKLKRNVRGALKRYTGAEYRQVNGLLRKHMIDDDSEHVKGIKRMIANMDEDFQFTLKRDVTLHRRVAQDLFENLNVGDEFVDDAFVSTSLAAPNSFHVIHIGARSGTRMSPVYHISAYSEELEVLLPRGARFRVVKKEKIDLRTETWVELID